MAMATGNDAFEAVKGDGWRRGLNNVLNGELKSWFCTRRWWVQILIWTASVNLIFFIVAITSPRGNGGTTPLMLFNIFMGLAGPIGVSIVMQSAMVGEKRSGTAAWVLSKPVSRSAFVLSKLIANAAGIVVTMVLAQGAIAYLIAATLLGAALPIPAFLAALGMHFANILFYLTLTLMVGVLFEQTAPVIGVPIAVLVAQNVLIAFFPVLAKFVPWTLAIPINNDQFGSIAMSLMTRAHVYSFGPLYSSLGMAAVFVAVALWVFERQEL
jgi:ABC-2 type transport system permease protein